MLSPVNAASLRVLALRLEDVAQPVVWRLCARSLEAWVGFTDGLEHGWKTDIAREI